MNEMPDIEVARYALRTFNVTDRLMPVAIPVDAWKGGVCEAKCERQPWAYSGVLWTTSTECVPPKTRHETPSETCACGIYGCLTIERLKRQYPLECMRVVAVIAVEGNTIIGDIGLRTQAARIVAYWTPERAVQKICADTCPGAVGFTSMDKMLAAYGFEPERSGWPILTSIRPVPTRAGRCLFWLNIACIAVNLALFVAGFFTAAGVLFQLVSIGAATLCAGSLLLPRRIRRRKVGAA